MPDGSISEEVLEKGVHYVDVALNEVPLFIRSGKCIPVAEAAECVKDIDTENMQLIGYEGSSYTPVSYTHLPSEWLGLENEELQEVTGLKTAGFCHKGGFLMTTGEPVSYTHLYPIIWMV